MQRYYVAVDLTLQQDRRKIAALLVTRRLRRCAEERRLGHLIRALQLTDTEFNDVLQRHDTASRLGARELIIVPAAGQTGEAAPAPHLNGSKAHGPINGARMHEASNGTHAKLNGSGPNEVTRHGPIVPTGPSAVETARNYAALLMTHWVASARLFAQADRICQTLQMPRSGLLQRVDELIAGAARLDLEGRIAVQIEQIIADAPHGDHRTARREHCARGAP